MPTVKLTAIDDFKPGQLYHNKAEHTIYLILEVKPYLLNKVRCMQFEDVSYIPSLNISNTITIKNLYPMHLLGAGTVLKTGKDCLALHREIVLYVCKANLIDITPIQTLWANLDKNRFEVGSIYKHNFNDVINYYLCIDIDEDNEFVFLNYFSVCLGDCLPCDDTLEHLELVTDDEHSLILRLFEERLNKHKTDFGRYKSKVSSYIKQL